MGLLSFAFVPSCPPTHAHPRPRTYNFPPPRPPTPTSVSLTRPYPSLRVMVCAEISISCVRFLFSMNMRVNSYTQEYVHESLTRMYIQEYLFYVCVSVCLYLCTYIHVKNDRLIWNMLIYYIFINHSNFFLAFPSKFISSLKEKKHQKIVLIIVSIFVSVKIFNINSQIIGSLHVLLICVLHHS